MASDAVTLIQATLAPIFLVNGAAIFLNFTQSRLFRVIDRMRVLAKELPSATDAHRENIKWQRTRHVRRAVILRNAILMGVLAIVFTIATTLLILLPSEFGIDSARWPIYSFTGALLCFAVALSLVATDAFLSVAAVRHLEREFGEPA
ncbi:MAG: DUF2721 domain-containing protein [Candidatus Thermoplasmatota archaeon]